MLKIYNTLSRDKQTFKPIETGKVSLYVCGMTVYDYCHLGHARVMVIFDMVSRWFQASDYAVTYVRNITDIDDKIIARANQNNESIGDLTQRFIDAMEEDFAKLGVALPTFQPRATAHIDGMINMITALITKGNAYNAANGDVYFSVRSFAGYGKLSGKSLDDLRAGERVEIDSYKKDPLDFVLWKSVKPYEPNWPSPWGNGRPGWHIECSAMSAHHLGAHFDIHGGGQDLQFPHHENEIAQSEAANSTDNEPCQMANYWMHNGFVRVINEKDGLEEKMSKSVGNFFTIRDILKKYDAEVVRFFILRAHYRSPLNYSEAHLDDAKSALTRLYTALRGYALQASPIDWHHPTAAMFKSQMDEDFNTPGAISTLFALASEINKENDVEKANLIFNLGGILGLFQRNADEFLQGKCNDELNVEALIQARLDAKKNKDFAQADAIRAQLQDAGIILEDTPQGTTWRKS